MHFLALRNNPVELSVLDHIKNKLNLVLNVPSYFPLDSDEVLAHLMYQAPPMKKARSSPVQKLT